MHNKERRRDDILDMKWGCLWMPIRDILGGGFRQNL